MFGFLKTILKYKNRNLTILLIITFLIYLAYWSLVWSPSHSIILDRMTHVTTLWDGGWFQTVPYEYSRLCVKNHVLPYAINQSEYIFGNLEYPYLAGYLFYGIYLLSGGSFETYCKIFQFINIGFQLGTVLLIYLLSSHFYPLRVGLVVGLLYSIAPSILYFSMSRYDGIPSFFALLSVYLFLKNRYRLSYASVAIGTLFKLYPILLLLPYIKHGILNKRSTRYYAELLLTPLLIMFTFVLPQMLISYSSSFFLIVLGISFRTFGWNWESVYGPIDQFVRPVFPQLAYMYINTSVMQVVFSLAILSVLLLDIRSDWQLVNAAGYTILCFLQTAWVFSPQYVVWISPITLSTLSAGALLIPYFLLQAVTSLEQPFSGGFIPSLTLHQFLYIVSSRVLLFLFFMVLFLVRIQKTWIISKLSALKSWWEREEQVSRSATCGSYPERNP